ncbi:nucleotide sugar dehydrogenase [Bosea caraganae]|uniref:Nucleotide sugar dehydrogenase n=1 Tax=Bosea caraganae TaxID=2763117 RepID=A0A370L6P7_9HYPH|nr:nucleotide sugar dehydrogenase [Bosea caraganae]RDJ25419.1 nucleotide sugar dehydrogenase [Bosea caraganae]RDJ25796.1 nucleotide sugar dehydrogenase [Bosea caraganae]
MTSEAARNFIDRVRDRSVVIGIIGLGYVGIPLALAALRQGIRVIGFDVNQARIDELNAGRGAFKHIPAEEIAAGVQSGQFVATGDFSRLGEPDALLIAVPTPLTKQREPNLSYVVKTSEAIASCLRKGQLVVLESTTYPGTTNEVMRPILEQASGLTSGQDFFLAFSPEREDPGNEHFGTSTIPKVVGGDGADALAMADALYAAIVVKTVPVSSTATAEAVKLTENIFRAVNIALVNELKTVYAAMGIDVWEVIDAAKTKPFGFMPFYPGPGLGGHCIPIDPFYLTWKAREYDITTRFIELAGQINSGMPYLVVNRLAELLDTQLRKSMSASRILVIGLAYKKNIEDMRESPSLKLIELIEQRGAQAAYHDPHIPVVTPTRSYPWLTGRASVPLTREQLAEFDAVLIATDHDGVDYALLAEASKLVVDTRNACARHGLHGANIFKA